MPSVGCGGDEVPADFGTFARYHQALRRLPERPVPPPLALNELDAFIALRMRAHRMAELTVATEPA